MCPRAHGCYRQSNVQGQQPINGNQYSDRNKYVSYLSEEEWNDRSKRLDFFSWWGKKKFWGGTSNLLLSICRVPGTVLSDQIQRWVRHSPCPQRAHTIRGCGCGDVNAQDAVKCRRGVIEFCMESSGHSHSVGTVWAKAWRAKTAKHIRGTLGMAGAWAVRGLGS